MTRPTGRALVGAAAALALLRRSRCRGRPRRPGRGPRGRGPRGAHHHLPAAGRGRLPRGVDTSGRYYYVTSTSTGAVFRGVIGRDEVAEVFLPGGEDGRTTAVGIEATDHLLLVAGGGTGTLFVHDRRTVELLGEHANGLTGGTFINDIAVARNGDAYVTDSAQDVVYRVPADEVGEGAPLEVFAAFAGVDPRGAFNANGIVVTSNGKYLVVVQSDTGVLGCRPTTATSGASAWAAPTSRPATAWSSRAAPSTSFATPSSSSPRCASTGGCAAAASWSVTDPSFMFPTTAALDRGRLLVVNGQFDQRGPGGDPVEPFTVSSIKRP